MTKKKKTKKETLKEKITVKYTDEVMKIYLEKLEDYPIKDHIDWSEKCCEEDFYSVLERFLEQFEINELIFMKEKEKILLVNTIEKIKQLDMVSEVLETIEQYEKRKEKPYDPYRYRNFDHDSLEDAVWNYQQEYRATIVEDVSENISKELTQWIKEQRLVRRLKISEEQIHNWLENEIMWDLNEDISDKDAEEGSNWENMLDFYDACIPDSIHFQKLCKMMNKITKKLDKELEEYFAHKAAVLRFIKQNEDSEEYLINVLLSKVARELNRLRHSAKDKKVFEVQETVFLSSELPQKKIKEIIGDSYLSYDELKDLYLFEKVEKEFDYVNGDEEEIDEDIDFEEEDMFYYSDYETDMLSLIIENIVNENPLDFNRKYQKMNELTLGEVLEKKNDKSFEKRMNEDILELKELYAEKEKQKQIWLKQIIGESVFEKYKTNNPEKIVIHTGETNTGKTYHALQELKKAKTGAYLAPLRLLALEVYEEMQDSGVKCSYITGEEQETSINDTHVSCTIERANYKQQYDCVVIDEAQMIGDKQRGSAWAKAILGIQTKELHIIVAPEGLEIIRKIISCENVEIEKYHREKPLNIQKTNKKINTVKGGEALIVFSRKEVLKNAAYLERQGKRPAIIYGSMPPSVRKRQVEAFKNGEYDVVVTTDAIGMGLNLPIEHVFFLENEKYDGKHVRELKTSELKQIAGRAGRRGFYEQGKVSFLEKAEKMSDKLKNETEVIEKIVINPTFEMIESFYNEIETVDAIDALEKFFANWKKYIPKEDFVILQNTQEEFDKLSYIRSAKLKNLSLNDLWRFIHMPFNVKDNTMRSLWLENVKCISNGENPKMIKFKAHKNLGEQELNYKKMDLQMQFFEEGTKEYAFYKNEKRKASDMIFDILKKEYGTLKKRCIRCKTPLKKDYEGVVCKGCINKAERKKRRKQEKLMKEKEAKK